VITPSQKKYTRIIKKIIKGCTPYGIIAIRKMYLKRQEEKKVNVMRHLFNKSVNELCEDSICIDLGANIGKITEMFLKQGAEVYAFEPNPIAYNMLRKRLGQYNKLHIIGKDASDTNAIVKLYRSKLDHLDPLKYSERSSIYISKENIDTNNFNEIEVVDFVKFIKTIDKQIDILKMDVEGAEYCILEKIINENLHKKFTQIFVEVHENRIPEIISLSKHVRYLIKKKCITNINLNWG
jgi:FkbM family methyltransferase